MITEKKFITLKSHTNVVLQETIVRRILGVGYIGIMSGDISKTIKKRNKQKF